MEKTTAIMNRKDRISRSRKSSGRSGMLLKKLQELESELAVVFRRPEDPSASDPLRQTSLDDINQRFSFLSKLLAAEVESQPQNSDLLRGIDERLAHLKADFREWNKSRSCFFSNPNDTMSICSDCTQALLYDGDVVESGSDPEEEFSGGKPTEKFLEKDEREGGERMWSEMGKYFGVFGCGMIVGAVIISMVVKVLFSSDHVIEYGAFLLPPPT